MRGNSVKFSRSETSVDWLERHSEPERTHPGYIVYRQNGSNFHDLNALWNPWSDHQNEETWRGKDSVDFETYIHAKFPVIRCPEHAIGLSNTSWPGKGSRFTASFETHAVGVLKSTDVTKASAILWISWDLAWNIMNKAVERGFGTKTSNPEITGLDDKSFGKPLWLWHNGLKPEWTWGWICIIWLILQDPGQW